VHKKYQEKFEIHFLKDGFQGVEPFPPEADDVKLPRGKGLVWELPRGSYYVVVRAVVDEANNAISPAGERPPPQDPGVDAVYEIGVATDISKFSFPDVPTTAGIIENPHVPNESCVYLPKHRYAPVQLKDGEAHWRFTQMKGAHELFGINVKNQCGLLDVRFDNMDALVQLFGPFDPDAASLPHFDDDGCPIKNDNMTHLSSRLQIASSEGCCKREGSGISSLVAPGRYVVSVFHCSIGINENVPYRVKYTLNKKTIPKITLGTTVSSPPPPLSRSRNVFYVVQIADDKPLATTAGDIYEVEALTDGPDTQGQIRVAVFLYDKKEVPSTDETPVNIDPNQKISYKGAYWGDSRVTFEPEGNKTMFIRVSILNGVDDTHIKTTVRRKK